MKRSRSFASKVAGWSTAVMLLSTSATFGQQRMSFGDHTGSGPEGTIGRGTNRLPGGPSDWGGERWSYLGGGQEYPSSSNDRASYPASTYSRGYASAPRTYYYVRPPVQRPYLTNLYSQPVQGYRYPLYYNPADGSYFYYPRSAHR